MSLRQLQPLSQNQISAAALAATEKELATVIYDATPSHPDDPQAFRKAFGVGPTGACLIRPDGYVAWRSIEFPLDPLCELAGALYRVSSAKPALHLDPTADVVDL